MMAALPILAMDESGNTGQNLLDPVQPIYGLAAVAVDAERAAEAAALAVQPGQQEIKFSEMRRTEDGRERIGAALDRLQITDDEAAISIAHKPFMAAAKLVDELIEPRMLARGEQMNWYVSGQAAAMADVVFGRGPRLGTVYSELLSAFVAMLRRYRSVTRDAYIAALRRARIAATDAELHEVLGLMLDDHADLDAEFGSRLDRLDPALPGFFWLTGHFSEQLGTFDVVHDDAAVIERWAEYLIMAAEADGRPISPERRVIEAGRLRIVLPYGTQSISFTQSQDDKRVQVADLLAGAAVYVYGAVSGLRSEDQLSEQLEQQGIGELIAQSVGPDLPESAANRLGIRP